MCPAPLVSVPVHFKMCTLQEIDAQDMTARDFELAGYVSKQYVTFREERKETLTSELDRANAYVLELEDHLKKSEEKFERGRLTSRKSYPSVFLASC